MRYLKIIFILLIITACNHGAISRKVETASRKSGASKIKIVEQDSIKDHYSMFYKHGEGESEQTLGITILDNKTINFHIETKTLPCDTNFWGKAINHAEFDGEIDSDNGEGYPSADYVCDEKEYILHIRLADDKSKAIIKFHQKDSLDGTDCLPIENEIMRRIE